MYYLQEPRTATSYFTHEIPMKSKNEGTSAPLRSRREFLTSAAALGVMPILPLDFDNMLTKTGENISAYPLKTKAEGTSNIGAYGPWATDLQKPTLAKPLNC